MKIDLLISVMFEFIDNINSEVLKNFFRVKSSLQPDVECLVALASRTKERRPEARLPMHCNGSLLLP